MGAGVGSLCTTLSEISEVDVVTELRKLSSADRQKLQDALKKVSNEAAKQKKKNVVILATSANAMGDHTTGAWSEEISGPYYTFKDAGSNVTIASITGGVVPIDAGSLSDNFKTENDKRFESEGDVQKLATTPAIADVDLSTVDCVFLAGGHGSCTDFVDGSAPDVVSRVYANGKVVGAVCHGLVGLVNAKDGDKPLLKGKKVTGFSDVEEGQVGLTEKVPFSLERRMKEVGGDYVNGDPWSETAVRDGRLVTGQNPQSSVKAAQLCLEAMRQSVVILATNASAMGDHTTGAWSEEISGPFYVFKDAGLNVTIASISGGVVPIDAGSLSDTFKTENDKRFESEGDVEKLANTPAIADVDLNSVDCVFFAGGHGTCTDFVDGSAPDVATRAFANGKVVGAVCHGLIGLVNAKDGDSALLKGKKVAGFSDVEEGQVGLTEKVPFSLEGRMKEVGGDYVVGDPWSETAVRDGRLVTGQNPQSSVKCAKLCLEALA